MGRWAQRRRSGTDRTGAPQALVTSVTKTGTGTLTWTFNINVTSDGVASPQLRDDTLGGLAPPNSTTQNTANSVNCNYSTSVNVGNAWSIVATPTHLTNPNGSGIAVPQGGTVT